MSELTHLERRIQETVAASKTRKRDRQLQLQQEMVVREQLAARFNRVADQLIETAILPRVQALAGQFENTEILPPDKGLPHHCVCRFNRTDSYPATTRLDLAVCPDDRLENILVLCSVEILPVLCQFEGRDQLAFPMNKVDEQQLDDWLDTKILGFVDTYLRLGDVEAYQRENLVVDPVCGMQINKTAAAAQMNFEGHTYYFCVAECAEKFAQDPGQYVRQRWDKKRAAI